MLKYLVPLFVLAGASAAMAQDLTGYEYLANWNDLDIAKTGVVAGLASSFDRTELSMNPNDSTWVTNWSVGNNDSNNYDSISGSAGVIREITGPGEITRIWSPALRGVWWWTRSWPE